MEVRIIPISDQPIPSLDAGSFLPTGSVGEIVVKGPVVTKEYDALPEATAAAKIPDPSAPGAVWHRMGDCGFLDASGRLWFLGRKVERVETAEGTLFTEPCEQVFRAHPRARRCALVGVSRLPALVVETQIHGDADAADLARELRALGQLHSHTANVRTFYFRPHLPVDVRHNAKIHRLALAKWAESEQAYKAA
jgi:acyl-CoA synthetase (AMP-forming)/AMP-acid ligase II